MEKNRNKDSGGMEAVQEEEEEVYSLNSPVNGKKGLDSASHGNGKSIKTNGLRSNRPQSLIIGNYQGSEEDKAQPPLPKLTAGDATIAGQLYPLVDEIACAIKEWYGVSSNHVTND